VLLLQPFMHKDDFAHYEKKAAERKAGKAGSMAVVMSAAFGDGKERKPRSPYVASRAELAIFRLKSKFNWMPPLVPGGAIGAAGGAAGAGGGGGGGGGGGHGPGADELSDIDDSDGEGELHHNILEAGFVPDAQGQLPIDAVAQLYSSADDGREAEDVAESDDLAVDDEDDIEMGGAPVGPSSAAAQPKLKPPAVPIAVRKSSRQAAARKKIGLSLYDRRA